MSSGIQKALAVAAALAATVAITPAAHAKLRVRVEVLNAGSYTAHICGLDWLGGYCESGVRKGQTADFTVEPRDAYDPIEIRVVVSKGGSEYFHAPTLGRKSCFEARGTAKNPTVEQVPCS